MSFPAAETEFPTQRQPSPGGPPPSATSPHALAANQEHRPILGWLLLALVGLVVLLLIPYLIEQIRYRGQLGENEALTELMRQPEFAKLGKHYTLVSKRLKPSVVHIDTKRMDIRGNDELTALFGPRMEQAQGQGSGVIVDPAGYIVTNYHVVAGAGSVTVHLSDSLRSYSARVVGTDDKNDLAVLKIDASDLIAAPWGDSDALEVGEIVFAMGNPFGLDGTLTQGIVSAKDRRGVNERSRYQEFLQTDAAVNPGNSGGPLVNIQGEIVGINTAIVGPTYQGISFAIPSNVAKQVYEQIRATGKVSNGYLGVGLAPLNLEIARQLKQPLIVKDESDLRGALITAVAPESPAAAAGLLQYDIIRKWNQREITEPGMLSYWVARTPVGTKVPVEILRDGQPLTLDVTVGERPAALQ
ncbi:MAG: trypsin-like peptidase domain-containing protein [Pirellulales bacterium]|nr:trypsin-like peptidase domain-containing protein [Pirellulales bacterium]